MNKSPKYRTLLRTIYGATISSGLSATELRSLAEELRRGNLPDELAYMIDQANKHFLPDFDEDESQGPIAHAETLVRERKVSRAALANILQSLGAPKPSSSAPIRKMLRDFEQGSSPARISKLIDVLESSSSGDAYLAGISSSRK